VGESDGKLFLRKIIMVPKTFVKIMQEIAEQYPNTVMDNLAHPRLTDVTVSDFLSQFNKAPWKVSLTDGSEPMLRPIWIWWEHEGGVYLAAINEDNILAGEAKA
jgi:hypothetical protein